MDNQNEVIQTASNDTLSQRYLTFHVSGQHYGISIYNVIEIVKIQPTTELPELPYYAKGIIDLRGKIIPVIDVNLRFDKPEKEYDDRTCIILVDIDDMQVGLIVDGVDEVQDIDNNLVSPPPSFSNDTSERYVTGIARLDKYMVLMLGVRSLLWETGMALLEQASERN